MERIAVEMRILPQTMVRIGELTSLVGAKSRTDTVVFAIDLALLILRTLKSGGEVIIERECGTRRERLVLPEAG